MIKKIIDIPVRMSIVTFPITSPIFDFWFKYSPCRKVSKIKCKTSDEIIISPILLRYFPVTAPVRA